jgi:hypothetical protein
LRLAASRERDAHENDCTQREKVMKNGSLNLAYEIAVNRTVERRFNLSDGRKVPWELLLPCYACSTRAQFTAPAYGLAPIAGVKPSREGKTS